MEEPTEPLCVEHAEAPLREAVEEARRVIRGDAFVSHFVESADQERRQEIIGYMAECLLAGRPVSPTYAIMYLGYWPSFKQSVFRLAALEERTLTESQGEGVEITDGQRTVLQEATAACRPTPLAA